MDSELAATTSFHSVFRNNRKCSAADYWQFDWRYHEAVGFVAARTGVFPDGRRNKIAWQFRQESNCYAC